jgi:hypothetical protein
VRKPEAIWKKTILIEPHPGDLSYAKGTGLTEFGPVPVEWSRDGAASLKFKFEIPEKTEAIIHLPKQGQHNEINLNGQPVQFTEMGRFLEFRVKSGIYKGVVSKL